MLVGYGALSMSDSIVATCVSLTHVARQNQKCEGHL